MSVKKRKKKPKARPDGYIPGEPKPGSARSMRPSEFKPEKFLNEEDELVYDWSHLNSGYKKNRERFAREYMKDFNAKRTILRMGLTENEKTASTMGAKWLNEPYTQFFLEELKNKLDEKVILKRADVILGLIREAHFDKKFESSHAARIAAFKTLGKFLGMERTAVDLNVNAVGSGVMRIPVAPTLEDWGKYSEAQQAKLKEDVKK